MEKSYQVAKLFCIATYGRKKVKINFYKNFYVCNFSEYTSILALVLPSCL